MTYNAFRGVLKLWVISYNEANLIIGRKEEPYCSDDLLVNGLA